MAEISRVALFGKLNRLCYRSIESSTAFCRLRGNPYVELVHWLHQLLQLDDSDLLRILRHFALDLAQLHEGITQALDRLPRGSTSITDLSSQLEDSVERAWVQATLLFGESQIRSGHLLYALLKDRTLRNALLALSGEFAKVKVDGLGEGFATLLAASPEARQRASDGSQPAAGEAVAAPVGSGCQAALERFAVDLTAQARDGVLDPVVGRDEEVRQVIDILMRRRQNNPLLVGEAGVGKTAVVEGLAQRIVHGDVPPALREVRLLALDSGLLQAGAGVKGEFEQRLRSLMEAVQASPVPVILFIDEAHTLVGSGGASGTGDAANLLKPALARGTLRTVGATTFGEYRKHIEKDPALTRRFQTVQVGEPDEAGAVLMLRGIAERMARHHQVQILDTALQAAVRMAQRYLPARQLPDKAISLLDTACARVAVSQHATPAAVEDSRRRIEALAIERAIMARERALGVDTALREAAIDARQASEEAHLAGIEARWQDEQQQVRTILELRARLGRQPDDDQALAALRERQQALLEAQGETPLILLTVDAQVVAAVVQDWTGIPLGRMVRNEIDAVLGLADTLSRRIIGQPHALEAIARRVQTARAGLDNPGKPVGVFLLAGSSGVGKTETALALAEALYGGEDHLVTLNMSEYQEAHSVSALKGSPPGYVGYGEGGVLTEAVRRKPYSVVLLDEIEKAHPDVHELFFQVFDKGWMEDGEGRAIDFRNTLILLTTNAGTEVIEQLCQRQDQLPAPDTLGKALRQPLLQVFPAALLGRLVVVPYYPLSDALLASIIRLQLGRIQQRLQDSHAAPLSFDEEVVALIASRCTELQSGGRMIDAILTQSVLPSISRMLLEHTLRAQPVRRVHIHVRDGEFMFSQDDAQQTALPPSKGLR
ncbi:type VI secretion system ATPase TssH [Pseudomonas sp. NPDC089401]|uniref:type VI secretion system ATPase TssH n=1 Tax=Pseudomonas sp. NPDC089401 TaxID=3364462 RepID=UPI00380E43BC